MTQQHEANLVKPHILIVGGDPILRQRLRHAFQPLGITYESVTKAEDALKRLDGGEPPVTGVLTDALRGEYPQVLEAAREIGARAVLMTNSSLTLRQAQEEDIPVYLKSQFAGRAGRSNTMVDKLIMDLAPVSEISPDL